MARSEGAWPEVRVRKVMWSEVEVMLGVWKCSECSLITPSEVTGTATLLRVTGTSPW